MWSKTTETNGEVRLGASPVSVWNPNGRQKRMGPFPTAGRGMIVSGTYLLGQAPSTYKYLGSTVF